MNLGQSTRDIEKLSYVRQWNIFDSLTMTNLHISFIDVGRLPRTHMLVIVNDVCNLNQILIL